MLKQKNFYLVGIKGVAMTALAGCLLDLKKNVRGSDVEADFPTKNTLAHLKIKIDFDFKTALAKETQVVIFSGANQGSNNPQVKDARKRGLLVYSHAQALSILFNRHQGVAVCGVGGKSTISGMLAFITQKLSPCSYSVGVGEIMGLKRTGQYLPQSKYFIAEADEYVADPASFQITKQLIPRFSYLHPQIIICTSLRFDHPDVYKNFAQTQKVYFNFFQQLAPQGVLIYCGDCLPLVKLVQKLKQQRPDIKLISYGKKVNNDYRLQNYNFSLNIPGEFNQLNALASYIASLHMNIEKEKIKKTLSQYRSVKRRFEYLGTYQSIECWDDYAHHPDEISAVIQAMQKWRPKKNLIIAFQAHTFSRTKNLFSEFVNSFATAQTLLMIDIFPSAREKWDDSISADLLCRAIKKQYPHIKVKNLHTIANLKKYLQTQVPAQSVFFTLGAGDIYQVFDDLFPEKF